LRIAQRVWALVSVLPTGAISRIEHHYKTKSFGIVINQDRLAWRSATGMARLYCVWADLGQRFCSVMAKKAASAWGSSDGTAMLGGRTEAGVGHFASL